MASGLLLVDDHLAIGQALAAAFRDAGFDPVEAIPPAAFTAEGVLEAARGVNPAVALVDLNLGRDVSGLPLIEALAAAGVPVVAFTAREDELACAESVSAGARGFVPKSAPFDEILDCTRRVAAGEQILPAARRAELLELARGHRARGDDRRARFASLTPRERSVLAGLMDGLAPKEIARTEGVSVSTVRSQVEAVRTKLGVHSQLAAVALAQEVGWRPS